MSQPKLISPLLDNFMIGEPMSDRNGIRCCPAMNSATNEKYIVKIISLPPSATQLDALLLTGVLKDEEDAKQYYKYRTQDWTEEIQVLQQLSKQEGFFACEGFQVVPAEDGIGYEIYILTPYARTLSRELKKKPFTQLEALNLGIDICSALAASRRNGYLFTNLKPSNIFITENGEFKIGDLGFLNLNALHYAAIAEHCLSPYTAPEIADASSSVNETVDVYGLGMLLYDIYNNGILPEDRTIPLSAPQYADEEMAQIILKACDPNPQERWTDPVQMGQMLVNYMQKNGAFNSPIVPPAPEPELENPEDLEEIQSDEEQVEEQIVPENAEVSEDIDAEVLPEDEEIISDADDHLPDSEEAAEPTISDDMQCIPEDGEIAEEYAQDSLDTIEVAEETIIADSESDTAAAFEQMQIQDIIDSHDAFAEEAAEIKAAALYLDLDTPQDMSEDISYDDVSEEVSQILAQADALAAMEVPEAVISPEVAAPEVPQPEPEAEEISEEESCTETDTAEEELYMNDSRIEEYSAKRPRWIRHSVLIALLLILIAGGFLFFKFYVLETINSLELTGTKDSLIVKIDTEADESLLSVTCQDKYGTEITAPVLQGTAEFTGLSPEQKYDIRVNISGLHILTGDTTDSHTTPEETLLLQYNVITGNEIGTVELNFTFDGPASENWTLTYATDGYEEQSKSFSGTNLTIAELEPYKTYNGVLTPADDLFITKPIEVTFSATELVQANDLKITGCANGKLTVEWTAPESVAVENWIVRCYSGTDGATYNQTHTTSATTFEFRDLNSAEGFTVEVKAEGQTIVQKASIGANSVTVSNLAIAEYAGSKATLTWDSETTPSSGWIVSYTVDEAETVISTRVYENTAVINGMIPNATYTFTVQSADEVHTFCDPVSCTTAESEEFSIVINNKKILAEDIEFSMFRHPDNENWTRYDITNDHYTNTFTLDQEAGFVGYLDKKYEESNAEFYTTFVIRNEQGQIVGVASQPGTWKSIWNINYYVFMLPKLPDQAGLYTVSIYLNGQFAQEQPFTIE